MAQVLLVRHAEPDWSLATSRGWLGPAVDLVPLTTAGIGQAEIVAANLAAAGVCRVVSSPIPRALQTAGIIARACAAPLGVAFDLREWLPDIGMAWGGINDVRRAYDDMVRAGGIRTDDSPSRWEALPAVRERAVTAIASYLPSTETIAVVCHEVVIYALTGEPSTPHAGIRRLETTGLLADREGSVSAAHRRAQ